MVPEDKLSHDERLRLECLSQAIAFIEVSGRPDSRTQESIVIIASRFEKFLKNGE